jgi:hypothetical protein
LKKSKNKFLKAMMPLMLLGSPAMAGGSSVRSGSRFKVKKAVVQSSSKMTTAKIEKQEVVNPFGIFGNVKTTVKKNKDTQNNVLDFLNEEGLIVSTSTKTNDISGDSISRKLFLGCSYAFYITETTCTGNGYIWTPDDATAPTQSSISSANVATTTVDIKGKSNEAGTMYYVISTSSSAPTNTQVTEGKDNSGSAAFKSANSSVSADTLKTFGVSGLSDGTQYYYYIVSKDAAGNKSSVSSGNFTTLAANATPVNTLPTAPIVKEDDTNIAFADTINIADTDSADTQTITLTATNGTISMSGTGVTVTSNSGDVTDVATITFSGTLTDINTALDSLTFKPTADFSGDAKLQIQTSDGNGGTDDDTLKIPVANAPEITSINRKTPSGENTNADSLIFTVTFSESVSGITKDDFSVNNSTATVTNVSSASGTTTDITISGGDLASLDATVKLNITDNNSIINAANVALGGTGTNNYSSGQTYEVDNTAPTTTISSIDISADTGSSDTDFLTKTASQTITATLLNGLASGEILQGSINGGTNYIDISSKVSGTNISWDSVTLSGTTSIKFKVTDSAGNDGKVVSENYNLDTTAPILSKLSPVDDAISIVIDSNLVMTLDSSVIKGTGDILIKKTSDDSTVETINITSEQVTISEETVTINPESDFDLNTEYFIQIPNTALTDSAGNAYAGITDSKSWSFKITEILNITSVTKESEIVKATDEDVTTKDTGFELEDIEDIEELKKDIKDIKELKVQINNDDGTKEEVKIVVNKDIETTISTTDKGVETKTEVITNGKTIDTTAIVNNNGTTEVKVITNGENEEKSTKLKSTKIGTDIEIKEDGGVEISFDLKDEDLGDTVIPSALNTDKDIIKSRIIASASSDDKAGTKVKLTIKNNAGKDEIVETKTSSNLKEAVVIITDEGSVQTTADTTTTITILDENGKEENVDVDVDVIVETDKLGKLNTELIITDKKGAKKIVSIQSEIAGTDTIIQENGSVETKAIIGGTNIGTTIKPDGESETILLIKTGEEKELTVKATSEMAGATTTLTKDGKTTTAVSTNAQIVDDNNEEQKIVIDLSIENELDGKTEHKLIAKDKDGNTLYEASATSELKGAEVVISKTGNLETKANIINEDNKQTELKVTTDINGNTIHTVSLENDNGDTIVSQATSNIKGAATVIKENGKIETKATPKIFKMEGQTIEAIVDTLSNSESYTRFKITNNETGESITQETTNESTAFEEGNQAVIKEEDGELKLIIDTKVTRQIVF